VEDCVEFCVFVGLGVQEGVCVPDPVRVCVGVWVVESVPVRVPEGVWVNVELDVWVPVWVPV